MWVIAHRGASKAAPENTLKAFGLALAQGASGIEFDTYQVEDQIVVIHDRWLERTTNASGLVTAQKISFLRTLDAGQGEKIPLLKEVLAMMPAHAICNIEIKHLNDVDTWLRCLDEAMAGSELNLDNLIISSFNHLWLRELKTRRARLQIGALTATYPDNGAEFATKLSAYSLHMDLDVIDEHYVREAQQMGLKVLVYTADQPEDIRQLQRWAVDGFFTNVPDLAKKVLGEEVFSPGTATK